jgi:hypothetical protein
LYRPFILNLLLQQLEYDTVFAWKILFVTQEKTFDLGSADPRGSPMAENLWLEIHQLKHIC